jgi:intein/homing endonuclease
VQVDVLNTEAHNIRLADTLKLLDEELAEKGASIEKYELEIKRRNDEIERKTRDIDFLNKKFVVPTRHMLHLVYFTVMPRSIKCVQLML